MKHTKEPWSIPHFAREDIACNCGYIFGDPEAGVVVAEVFKRDKADRLSSEHPPMEQAKANALRIPSCINFCQGIPTEVLEKFKLSEIVEKLLNLLELPDSCPPEVDREDWYRILYTLQSFVSQEDRETGFKS